MIGHSVVEAKSPQIQSTFAAKMELPYVMIATDVTVDGLEKYLEAAKVMGLVGFSVTMPLKEKIISYFESVPVGTKAVNTVAIRDGKLFGKCTDGCGFVGSLERFGFNFHGSALILGAGGAAKGIVPELVAKGMSVLVYARRPETFPITPGATASGWADLARLARDVSLLVNATPIGMAGVEAEFTDFAFLDGLPEAAIVYDIIHTPRKTKLIAEAEKRGHRTLNGIPMVVGQAVSAFEFWTGHAVRPDVVAEVEQMMQTS
jgi:shikimate dehydrogenase